MVWFHRPPGVFVFSTLSPIWVGSGALFGWLRRCVVFTVPSRPTDIASLASPTGSSVVVESLIWNAPSAVRETRRSCITPPLAEETFDSPGSELCTFVFEWECWNTVLLQASPILRSAFFTSVRIVTFHSPPSVLAFSTLSPMSVGSGAGADWLRCVTERVFPESPTCIASCDF